MSDRSIDINPEGYLLLFTKSQVRLSYPDGLHRKPRVEEVDGDKVTDITDDETKVKWVEYGEPSIADGWITAVSSTVIKEEE